MKTRHGAEQIVSKLRQAGIDPGPKRMTGDNWDEFLKRHAASLWQCDFVTKRIWTFHGKVEAFGLFFIHVESRKVWASPASVQPDPVWVMRRAGTPRPWR